MSLPRILDRVSGKHSIESRDSLLAGVSLALVGGGLWWAWGGGGRTRARHAPGAPGEIPSWNFSGKDGVGTAISEAGPDSSRVWFTIRDGAFTEIFYPRADLPAVRELRLIVTDSQGRCLDERVDTDHRTHWIEPGVPAFELTNSAFDDAFCIEKTVLTHPRHDAVLQATRFVPRSGTLADYRLFVYLTPHPSDQGAANAAWVEHHKGTFTLFSKDSAIALALACSTPWRAASAGFVSRSDGLRDLKRYGSLQHLYDRAERGNVALTAEVDLQASGGEFVISLGFGTCADEAAHRTRAALFEDFRSIRDAYLAGWRDVQEAFHPPCLREDGDGRDLSRASLAVLRTHEDKSIPGAIVAALAIPWGEARSDDGTGQVGYHIVWPRDAVECAGALLSCGSRAGAIRILRYLHATQNDDGHWSQNFWVDGATAWESNQMGETALPILLLDLIDREAGLEDALLEEIWPMVRSAAAFIVQQGPSSEEDRWEDAHGFTPFTLSALISALLAASSFADRQGEKHVARYLEETADIWCESLEYWTYVTDTELSRRVGVPGYYIRIAPADDEGNPAKRNGIVNLWYQPIGKSFRRAEAIVSPDALAYVRFGLRAADDPRIVNTVRVIDAELRVETPYGPGWYRSTDDGYGEKKDGEPFGDNIGIGRLWPLLTGERGHYELAAGHRDEALRLLHAMEAFANETGMIPEQVWDTADIPEYGRYFGRPTGSAMPLAWAHAEYMKLRRSLADGRIYDMPSGTYERYVVQKVGSPFVLWRANHQRPHLPAGKDLRVELRGSATIRWHSYHDHDEHQTATYDTSLGIHVADLQTRALPAGTRLNVSLTRHDPDDPGWQAVPTPRSFTMTVVGSDEQGSSNKEPARESAT